MPLRQQVQIEYNDIKIRTRYILIEVNSKEIFDLSKMINEIKGL